MAWNIQTIIFPGFVPLILFYEGEPCILRINANQLTADANGDNLCVGQFRIFDVSSGRNGNWSILLVQVINQCQLVNFYVTIQTAGISDASCPVKSGQEDAHI